jgi:hypothetical protein
MHMFNTSCCGLFEDCIQFFPCRVENPHESQYTDFSTVIQAEFQFKDKFCTASCMALQNNTIQVLTASGFRNHVSEHLIGLLGRKVFGSSKALCLRKTTQA